MDYVLTMVVRRRAIWGGRDVMKQIQVKTFGPLTSSNALVNEGDDDYGITDWYHPDDQFKTTTAKKIYFTIGTKKPAEDTLPAPNNEFGLGKNLV